MALVTIVAIVAFITYQLGIVESPPFVHHTSLLAGRELHAIMATTRERDIGKHVVRLKEGSKQAVDALENHESTLKAAAKLYEVEDKASSVGVGLYFDDPFGTEHPRWAIGWAVEGSSYEELQAMVPQMQEASGLDSDTNPLRVVRIGGKGTEIITARIPWRNMFTPMIAPMLHWGRGFSSYQEYAQQHPELKEVSPSIALEVYVTGENDAYQFIDYTVLFGAVGNTWEDTFPGSSKEEAPRAATATK